MSDAATNTAAAEAGPEAPLTTLSDLELGLYNVVVTIVMQYRTLGYDAAQAFGLVATRLEEIAAGLRSQDS